MWRVGERLIVPLCKNWVRACSSRGCREISNEGWRRLNAGEKFNRSKQDRPWSRMRLGCQVVDELPDNIILEAIDPVTLELETIAEREDTDYNRRVFELAVEQYNEERRVSPELYLEARIARRDLNWQPACPPPGHRVLTPRGERAAGGFGYRA